MTFGAYRMRLPQLPRTLSGKEAEASRICIMICLPK
jgi:hypothetical protein